MFGLALRLHQPVSTLLRQLPASELIEWLAWFDLTFEDNTQPMTEELTADQQYAQMRRVLG